MAAALLGSKSKEHSERSFKLLEGTVPEPIPKALAKMFVPGVKEEDLKPMKLQFGNELVNDEDGNWSHLQPLDSAQEKARIEKSSVSGIAGFGSKPKQTATKRGPKKGCKQQGGRKPDSRPFGNLRESAALIRDRNMVEIRGLPKRKINTATAVYLALAKQPVNKQNMITLIRELMEMGPDQMSDKQVILGKLQTYGAYQNGKVRDEAIQIVSALYDAASLEFEKSRIMMILSGYGAP